MNAETTTAAPLGPEERALVYLAEHRPHTSDEWRQQAEADRLNNLFVESRTLLARASALDAVAAGDAPLPIDRDDVAEAAAKDTLAMFLMRGIAVSRIIDCLEASVSTTQTALETVRDRLDEAMAAERVGFHDVVDLLALEQGLIDRIPRIQHALAALPLALASRLGQAIAEADPEIIARGIAPDLPPDHGGEILEADVPLRELRADLAYSRALATGLPEAVASPILAPLVERVETRVAELQAGIDAKRDIDLRIHEATITALVPQVNAVAAGDLTELAKLREGVAVAPQRFPATLLNLLDTAVTDALAGAVACFLALDALAADDERREAKSIRKWEGERRAEREREAAEAAEERERARQPERERDALFAKLPTSDGHSVRTVRSSIYKDVPE